MREQSPNVNFVFFCQTSWYPVCTNILHYSRSTQTILCTVPTNSSSAVNKYQIVTCQLSGIISSTPATFTSFHDVFSWQMAWLSVWQLTNSLCQFLTFRTVIMLPLHTYTNCWWISVIICCPLKPKCPSKFFTWPSFKYHWHCTRTCPLTGLMHAIC